MKNNKVVITINKFNSEYLNKYRFELLAVQKLLEHDKKSLITFNTVIQTRLSKINTMFSNVFSEITYTPNDIFEVTESDIVLDCGAAYGDSLSQFIQAKQIYAIEPDSDNFKLLKQTVIHNELTNVIPIHAGVWCETMCLPFYNEYGIFLENINGITIDSLKSNATYIKMDIEGSELEALHGAEKLIATNKPKLAICVYHKPEHLFDIPLYINKIQPKYKFYFRHQCANDYFDSILFCR